MSIFLIATCDTKGTEAEWLRTRLVSLGVDVVLVDTGCMGQVTLFPDVDREEVFANAETTVSAVARGSRKLAWESAARGVTKLLEGAHRRGEVTGVLGIGGTGGTTVGTAAMRAVPNGIPKLMVSTVASGEVQPYVQAADILMLNAPDDLSEAVLSNAAAAMAGMVQSLVAEH